MLVLILEDDPFLQFDIAEIVEGLGYDVVGPFSAEPPALTSCKSTLPHAALLDYNLGDGAHSSKMAYLLLKNDIPFAFMTGHSRKHLPTDFDNVPIIEKPFREADISHFLAQI